MQEQPQGYPILPAQTLGLGSPHRGSGCPPGPGWGQPVGRTPGACQPTGWGRELLCHSTCCLQPKSHLLQGVCHLESFTNPKSVKSDSHLHIKPFYTFLTAYEGHKISSNVIYLCFKAPLQSQNDLCSLGAHDQQALNI